MIKKIMIYILTAALLISMPAFLISCSEQGSKFSVQSFKYFDTVTTVIGLENDRSDFDKLSSEIMNELAVYHRLYDIYREYDGITNLCTVNSLSNGEHRILTVDSRITDLLLYSKEVYTLTSGRINVAMGSVLSLWHNCRTEAISSPDSAKIPSLEALTEASEHTDINNLVIDKESNTVFISDPVMTLDVGAVAKGYALERVAKHFEERGVCGYVINIGGNVRAIGERPDGEKWSIGIEDPKKDSDGLLSQIKLDRASIATSGSYQRYYEVDGKRYHHIIDPLTLMPSESFVSVSVITESAALADVLSTALFCMDYESGRELIVSMPEVEAMWVFSNGDQNKTDGFSDYE